MLFNDCPLCEMSFAGKNALQKFKQHIKKHRQISTICNLCNKDFKYRSKITAHIKVCKGPKIVDPATKFIEPQPHNDHNYALKDPLEVTLKDPLEVS